MLAATLPAEVAGYIHGHAGEVDADGRRLVVRNGSHPAREVTTAAAAVPVQAPRVNDKRTESDTGERRRFSSAILPAWSWKSPRVVEVLPLLYLHGLSSSDFVPGLEQFLGLRRRPVPRGSRPLGRRFRRHGSSDLTVTQLGKVGSQLVDARSRTDVREVACVLLQGL